MAGASKPTITAPQINRIKIPSITKTLLKKINADFEQIVLAKCNASKNINDIEKIFSTHIKFNEFNKGLFYVSKSLGSFERWDPHYHNPLYQRLRNYITNTKLKTVPINSLFNIITNQIDYSSKKNKIGYIEISDINNKSGLIENITYDYPKKLPTGPKLLLKKYDLLISKVRPYLNNNAIFHYATSKIAITASKNAFSIYRPKFPQNVFYPIAFIRYLVGLHQLIMYQSGTSYPTISEDDIENIKIVFIKKEYVEKVNQLYKNYLELKFFETSQLNIIINKIIKRSIS
jgi:type I restriction enzyme S subunit